jgi:radical SAM superfamily enzyme YgiQ (UPF0313 family)
MTGTIVLFSPGPSSRQRGPRRVDLPLGLLSVATPLDLEGYSVKIIDAFANPVWKKDLLEATSRRPLCFGVTCMTGPGILQCLEVCRLVKERHPDVPIIWGGVHASLMPEQTLRNSNVDVVVVGEGEETFPELIKALQAGAPLGAVAGICYLEDGKPRFTGHRAFVNIDQRPPLSYNLLDMDLYSYKIFGTNHMGLNSSRGCTFDCAFCWDSIVHKKQWRAMRPETVMEHMRRIVRDYGVKGFLFTDDNFFLDMNRAYGVLEAVVRSGLDISIGKLQLRSDAICRMDKDFLELMVRARVKRLMVGAESGSQRILDLIKKNLTVDEIVEGNRRLAPYPIMPLYLFMMGLPTETPEDFTKSVDLALRLTDENPRATKAFTMYTPYPGTELYALTRKHGLAEPVDMEGWAGFNYNRSPRGSRWIEPELASLIEGLDFPLKFMGKGYVDMPETSSNPLVLALSRLYYPLARYRVLHKDTRFPLDTRIANALGFFGRR